MDQFGLRGGIKSDCLASLGEQPRIEKEYRQVLSSVRCYELWVTERSNSLCESRRMDEECWSPGALRAPG